MAKVLTDESNYEDIADAIREKNGSSDTYLPSEMAEAVRDIPTGGAVQSVNGKTGAVVLDASDVGAGTYSKPSGGIPKADLASAVQTSLGKADTALQTAPVTSVNSKTGAVNITPADIGAKAVQTAVNDPSSSGSATTMAFISNITQNAQGVVSPTKKTIPPATTSADGIMTSQNVKTMLAAYGMGNAAEYSFAPSSRHEATYPIKAGSIFTHGGSASYGEWLYRALVDIANANQISSATAEQIRVSDLYNELLASILAAYPMDSAEGRMASFSDGAAGLPLKALTVGIVPVQAGSGTPSPTNVRAISGWTGASITRCGKNLLKLRDTLAPVTIQGVAWQLNDDGSISASRVSTSSSNSDWSIAVLTLPPGQYVYSGVQSGTGGSSTYQSNIKIGDTSHWGVNPYSFTLTEPTQIEVVLRYYPGYSGDAVFYPMVRLNSQSGEFEAYQGAVYPITFPTEAVTVYGGTLDVTTGALTVDRIMITIDGSTDSRLASFNTSDANVNRVQSNIYNDIGVANIAFDACDRFEPIAPTTTSSLYKVWNSPTAPRMFFGLPKTVTTLDEAKAWFAENPTHIVAKIASPQTYQLDPTEVLTLLGTNTIFADCGDVSVTYRADPTLFASKGQTEDDMTANAPIAIGKYFQIGNTLYRATAAIATGETIAPEINCVVTNLAEALNLLNT